MRFVNDEFNKYQTKKSIRYISNEQIERLRQIGLSSEHTKKVSKRVEMYDLKDNFIKEYSSVTQAIKENGTGVIEVLNGRQRKTHGLIFKFI